MSEGKMLEGKVAVVTGAGRGIGRGFAMMMAAHGAKVVVNDINVEGGQRTVELIEKEGGGRPFFLRPTSPMPPRLKRWLPLPRPVLEGWTSF